MTKARTLADMISDGVIGTTELADDVITPVKLDETGSYTMAQLGVNGSVNLSSQTDGNDGFRVYRSDGTLTGALYPYSSKFQIASYNNQNIVISSSANIELNGDGVGVGTTSVPSDASLATSNGIKLEVGTSDTSRIYAKSTGTGVYNLGTSGGSAVVFHRLADNSDEIGFETHHAGNNHTERMRLNYHGQLTLEGTGLSFDTTPSKNGLQLYYESDSGIATVGSYSSGGNTALSFHTNLNSGASTEVMRLNEDGNVGIGVGSLDALQSRTSFNYKSLRVQNFNINAGDSNYGFIGQNLYQDTAGQTKYIDSGYSSSIHFWGDQMQFHMGTGSADATQSNTEKLRMVQNGNMQQFKQVHYGYTYSTNNGYIDTDFTAADGYIFEISGYVNPNSGGSTYRDVFHGHIYIGHGWSGSALTHYVYFVLDTPPARDIYASGSSASGNDIDVVIHNNGTETNNVSQADSSNWNIRLKASNYNTSSGAQFVLNITRKL